MSHYCFGKIEYGIKEFIIHEYPGYSKASSNIRTMIDLISRYFPYKLSEREMSFRLNITVRWLQSECRKTFGITYSSLIRIIKVNTGLSLITNNKISYRQAAVMLNYSSTGNMTRDFKKVFGLTPTEVKQYLEQIDIKHFSLLTVVK